MRYTSLRDLGDLLLSRITLPVIVGFGVWLLTSIAVLLWIFGVPLWVFVLLYVPIIAAVVGAIVTGRYQHWQKLATRRSVLLLQMAAGVCFASPLINPTLKLLSTRLRATAEGRERLLVDFVAIFDASPAWIPILMMMAGAILAVLAHLVANSADPVALPQGTSSTASSVDAVNKNAQVSWLSEISPLKTAQLQRASAFIGYGSDRPPEISTWVGRDDELDELAHTASGVVTITGIGGQGKSTLAAKALKAWQVANPKGFWDWRDCKEQGDRFPAQLACIIHRLTLGEMSLDKLEKSAPSDIARLFFRLVRDVGGYIVLDNVDQYVDVESEQFAGDLSFFVAEALRTRTPFVIVLTCRPQITYGDPAFRPIRLQGLSDDDAIRLFRSRSVKRTVTDQYVREINRLTQGHAFWLTMLAFELSRKPSLITKLLQQLRAGQNQDDRVGAMLRPVWKAISQRARTILSVLSECSRPISDARLARMLEDQQWSSSQFSHALKEVVALGIVSKRTSPGEEPLYELHAVVRQFLRAQMAIHERRPFMAMIANGTDEYLSQVRKAKGVQYISFQTLEYAAMNIEARVDAGDFTEAATALDSVVADAFVGRGLLQEYVRLGKLVLDGVKWDSLPDAGSEHIHRLAFDLVCRYTEVGREDDSRKLIATYESKVPKDTPTRIRWNTRLCRLEWLLGNFDAAIKYGEIGHQLKQSSGIDTDADASHQLNLALREAGRADKALEYFTQGMSIEEALRNPPKGVDHAYFGNIGRCLHLMGKPELAIRFLAPSWKALQLHHDARSIENRGWAGLWIGEHYLKQDDLENASLFLSYCRDIWRIRLPVMLKTVEAIVEQSPGLHLRPAEQANETAAKCDAAIDAVVIAGRTGVQM